MSGAPILRGGTATGIGSMPGTDPLAAARVAFNEVALSFVPELPGRGIGADMVGRAAAILVDIPMEIERQGYRLASGRTRLMSRADGFLRADFDAAEEVVERGGLSMPCKLAAIGPFTFAALVELPSGHKVLHDRGAWRDVVASLAEGLARRADDLARRLGVDVVVQLDEPMVGRVIDGEIAPLTRLDVNRAIPAPDAAAALEEIAARVGRPMVLHSCAAPRWDLIGRLSSYAVSLDVTGIDVADYDPLGGFVDGGGTLIAGVVPTSAPAAPLSADELAGRLLEMTDRIGLPRSVVREHVLVSPTCGLAGAGEWAAPALALSSRIADQLARAD
ncbi:MAG TPA: vitamin-B12 independent methionine synthase [Gordonia sp. (in: high G+C Gram-positive bacteria)]|uniref:vitamin-B12 independent methionine synthase n=1 Tax=unclassified Gordonia (in: high G+C Gram-positive bacteria) TaxID=2657482 RepID=UPI000FB187C2|nr:MULTISPECIES: vitamin-B12 independent methionine synthase [unclassified Gordonia (in: high G+C Gram-positive bacteria)]RUP36377.1 MAG: vitamin-B12 independent methionine synthase [Gordonia sp. (in: high G+C Gram-positive bacteria)]HNP59112.1 vitamin-B12 independent methionine synthase [Gordonia sp. (in: high G+C Gram-positive bacteria)]HRC52854.1 vitamin-B12 independent methionine synthase [Gordonia sp. (in: high G+C Gram-positive bacteria)]